jgi:hypothetical protein
MSELIDLPTPTSNAWAVGAAQNTIVGIVTQLLVVGVDPRSIGPGENPHRLGHSEWRADDTSGHIQDACTRPSQAQKTAANLDGAQSPRRNRTAVLEHMLDDTPVQGAEAFGCKDHWNADI